MRPIEHYALLGDTHSAALVSREGSVDWLCWPRFDSDACFAALLGSEEHGHWQVAPATEFRCRVRRYRPRSMVLETEFETAAGAVRIVDCLALRVGSPRLIRLAQGLSGYVPVRALLRLRFGFGARTPWQQGDGRSATAMAGPDAVVLRATVPLDLKHGEIESRFSLAPGEEVAFELAWYPSHDAPPPPVDASEAVANTDRIWQEWSQSYRYRGKHADAVLRSVLTLKALTYSPTGAVVAAPTTSLPEKLGGMRNWDYRFCWLRDATLTLLALMDAGFVEEAVAFRDWLVRSVAGEPDELQVLYGVLGERRLTESELPWLPGYASSRPVRIGNAAHSQLQLDVYGEVLDCLYQARTHGSGPHDAAWAIQRALVEYVQAHWRDPDEGIWEVRGPRQHFTHSKVMAWVAVDRAIKAAQKFSLPAPVAAWQELRRQIHAEVCDKALDGARGHFVQTYGSEALDASLLMIPLVGFLPAEDPRMVRTVQAIERELMQDGLVHRYDTARAADGLPPGEGVFIACSFWLANNYLLQGRRAEAEALFERVLALSNDVGLLAEQYDPHARRLVGNFPQAFSHVGLVDTAFDLYVRSARAAERSSG